MGVYLNPGNQNFTQQVQTGTYIDKTMLIEETNRRLDNADFKFVCISRPRRFGKSIAEDMLAA
ncbi:MAG: AAA family ATPase, partial [Spirochaetales bacterium]|nr:AAA family ATPase [Spirochaetales bacterium]